MKKFILAYLFLVSVFSFSLEKSGIKDYDNLDLSKGKVIAYFNTKKQIVEEPDAMFYRKDYGTKGSYHLVADFYADTDTPEKIFMLRDLDDEDSINGKLAYYNKDETISYVADMKNGRIDGQKTTFEKGKVAAVINFSNNLANGKGTLYYKEKKYAPKILLWMVICSKGVSNIYVHKSQQAVSTDIYFKECIIKQLLPFIEKHHKNDDYVF